MDLKISEESKHFLAFLVVGIYLLTGKNPVVGNLCAKKATERHVPRIDFCSGDMIQRKTVVVIDWQHFSTDDAIQRCTCIAKAQFPTATKITFGDILTRSSMPNDCGSKVVFSQGSSVELSQSCHINGSLFINVTENIEITLIRETKSADTSYCFYIKIDQGNELDLTCNQTDLWMNSSTESQTGSASQLYTDTVTSDTPEQQYNVPTKNQKMGSSQTKFIAIGSTVGGVLLVVIVMIYLVTKSRREKDINRESNAPQEVNDDYGLHYNTMYVSSDNDCVEQNISNRQVEYGDNQITYQVEGNYSEIDLKEMPKNRTKTKAASAIDETDKCNMNLDSNYSEIELNEHVLTSISSKAKENSESKCLIYIESETFTENSNNKDKHDNFSSVRHVVAPGDDGFEYAVVEKANDDCRKNDVYAVVDKTRKKDI